MATDSQEEIIPRPSFERVDYASPENYLGLEDCFGGKDAIKAIAEGLKCSTAEKTLSAIHDWIEKTFQYSDDTSYCWQSFDDFFATKQLFGSSSHALIFAALARCCGIPCVFVKTMHASWIHQYRTGSEPEVSSGQVFLEVHWKRKWRLLDTVSLRIYDDYDPEMRIFPEGRYAYDKGADPKDLILPLEFERWKKQLGAYFKNYPLAKLPVGEGREIRSDYVYIAAGSPIHQAIDTKCTSLGMTVKASFNWKFEKYLKEASGQYLFIACIGDQLVLEPQYYDEFLPISYDRLMSNISVGLSGIERKELRDGTKVTLLYAKDTFHMFKLVDSITVWSSK